MDFPNNTDLPEMDSQFNYENYIDSESIEWLRNKLNSVWYNAKFCGICLGTQNLNSVNMEILVNRQQESKSLLDIISFIFKEDIEDLMSCPYICDKCIEKILQSFIFINNTKKLSKIINSCIKEMYQEIGDLNQHILNLIRCENSNLMIVLAKNKELLSDIREMNTVSEIVPTQKPVIKLPIISEVRPERLTDHDYITTTEHITAKAGEFVINPIKMTNTPSAPEYMIYKCTKCAAIFTTHKSLKEHEKFKHCNKVYSCKICSKVYLTLQSLDLHYKSHDVARCRFCMDIMLENELMEHLKKNHGSSLFSCEICDSVFYNHEAFQIHVKSSHVPSQQDVSLCQYCCQVLGDSTHKCKYNCPECSETPCIHHRYLISYRDQMLSHASKAVCLDCNYTTSRKEYLITHANREHLDHHPFTCMECNKQFYTKHSLKMHYDQFHLDITCEYCDREFKSATVLSRHKLMCQNIERVIKCSKCEASFENSNDLDKHVFLKHDNGGFQCDLCKKRFLEDIELQQHKVMIHTTVQYKKRRRNIECTLCDIQFKTIKLMQQHQDEIHSPGTLFPCKNCPKKFIKLKQLQLHQHKHGDRKKCEKCKRKIIAAFYMKHAIGCNATFSESYACEICGKVLHTETALKIHLKTHKRVSCEICNKSVRESLIEKHLDRHHNVMKPKSFHACDLCGHVVRKKHELETHINRYHLKIKPFKCDKCDKTFCGRARLKEHLLTHEINTCICNICNKVLANRVCLKMHLRIHTGECPYTCEHCGDKFRSASIRKTHIRKKHTEKSVCCPSCDSMFHFVREMRYHFKHVHWKDKEKPFNYKEALPKTYHHLFEDSRLPKIDS